MSGEFVFKELSDKLDNNEYVYTICVEDVQELAIEILGRKLNFEEMRSVKDGVEWGMMD